MKFLYCPPYVTHNITKYIVESCTYNKSDFIFVKEKGPNKGEPLTYENVIDLVKYLAIFC